MKIQILQAAGKHPENAQYRECLSLQRGFRHLGIDTVVYGPGYDSAYDNMADVNIVLENYDRTGWLPDLSKSKALKIFWSIDPHCVLARHLAMHQKNRFDIVLCSIRSLTGKFGKAGVYMPNAFDDCLIDRLGIKKEHDIGFCGSMGRREDWIRGLQRSVGLHLDSWVLGDDMVRAINKYRIHWNRNHSVDINYRTFETMGCGTFLMTNATDQLHNMFKEGKHLVTYSGLSDCIAKVKYYLDNERERERIAAAGYEEARKKHTYRHRAEFILNLVKERG